MIQQRREPEDPEVIARRWDKKKEQIALLSANIRRLRYNVSSDLKSGDEKVALTALVVALMDKTAERVGNRDSEQEGHFGVTGLRKKHVKVNGNKITLKYIGKSGVLHDRTFSDEKLALALEKAISRSKGNSVFQTSGGFRVKNDRVNRYLKDFGIRSKDIRGYSANRMVLDKLNNLDPEECYDEKKRKRAFLKSLREVAAKVGHGSGTLRKHYLIPELEIQYIQHGNVIDISDRDTYEDGGVVQMRKLNNSIEEKVRQFLHEGKINSYDLRNILGYSPGYPFQMAGSLKLKKKYMHPIYEVVQ